MKVWLLFPGDTSTPPTALAAILDETKDVFPKTDGSAPETKGIDPALLTSDFLSCYDQLSEWLASDEVPSGSIISVAGALADGAKWNLMQSEGWTTLVGLLVLSFPEMRWVIHGLGGYDLASSAAHTEWPLTDGSGLREFIRQQTVVTMKSGRTQVCFPRRTHCFASLDEEQDYAFFNAFTAFRFGYRAVAPLSWKEAQHHLKGTSADAPVRGILEDVFLQYADQPDNLDPPMSHFDARDQELPALSQAKARVLITSGGMDRVSSRGGDRERQNLHHVQSMRRARVHVPVIGKPLAGMFRLWTEAGMIKWLRGERADWQKQNGPCFSSPGAYGAARAPGFERSPNEIDDEPGNHSAPGRLLMVARSLLERAETLLASGVDSVEEAVRGAVLATEALEMLGNRTPTTALEALAAKHQFEVLAECQFIGVRHNIEVKQRIEELRHDIATICRRFAKNERTAAGLDAEVAILGKLVKVFQDHNQFDEEMQCLYWQRHAMAKLFQARGWFLAWFFGWIWRYLNWLVRTPKQFLLGIIIWLGVGTIGFSLAASLNPAVWTLGLNAVGWTLDAFFAGNAPSNGTAAGPVEWVARPLTVLGLFHFGVFISYVYTLISRK